jgi:hypothetical protein
LLLPPNLLDKLSIRIDFFSGIPDHEGFSAATVPISNRFLIGLSRTLSRQLALRTLAHEMVHVKQWAKGELRVLYSESGEKTAECWKKRVYRTNRDGNLKARYGKLPWEREAFGLEETLYRAFSDDE